MADVFLGDSPVVSGNLDLCLNGAWTSECFLAGTTAPPKGTTLNLTIRERSRLCTVVDVGADYLQVKCRLVAGRGKLDAVIEARDYRGYQAAAIAQDTLQDAGEVPGSWDPLQVYCGHWQRPEGPCRDSLRRLLRLVDGESTAWRVLDDGTVDLVVDDYAVVATPKTIAPLGSWGQERLLLLGVENSDIVPGKSVSCFGQDFRVNRSLFTWDSDNFNCRVWWF